MIISRKNPTKKLSCVSIRTSVKRIIPNFLSQFFTISNLHKKWTKPTQKPHLFNKHDNRYTWSLCPYRKSAKNENEIPLKSFIIKPLCKRKSFYSKLNFSKLGFKNIWLIKLFKGISFPFWYNIINSYFSYN